MVMVYDGGGTVPHCKYTGRFGDLTAYWQEIVSDAVYLFRHETDAIRLEQRIGQRE